MSDTIIKVENLSKKYLLSHLADNREQLFSRLLANKVRSFGTKLTGSLKQQGAGKAQTKEDFWALNDVSFEIKQGDRVGIIGRNGAGKSTLLKILSRITEPTKGRITIDGRVASLLEVGTGFHSELTGRENIYLNGSILGMSKEEIKRKFDEIVAFAEVENFLDTPVKRYSSGMYVRLAFAVAAHLDPEILIVDEVLAVGDAQFQKKCLGKMEEVSTKEGRTVLFVSHNLAAIRSFCSRAILLKQGRVIADDVVDQAIEKYVEEVNDTVMAVQWGDAEKAPQNATTVLQKITVCDEDGIPLQQIFTDTEFVVEIEYVIKKDDASNGLTLMLFDQENQCVFSSISNHEPNWYGKPMKAGSYKTVCKVPANLLNNGWYYMSFFVFSKGFSDATLVKEAIRLEVLDGPTVRGDFFGIYAGSFRPQLEWVTTKLGR